MQDADTPGSTPRGYGRPNGGAVFTLSDELEHQDSIVSPSSEHHRPQAVFNLDMEYSDDDALLDWEQYAAMKRVRLCVLAVLLVTLIGLLVLAAVRKKDGKTDLSGGLNAELCSWEHWRLPTAVLPLQYNLTLEVQMQEPWQVQGEVGIDLNVTQAGIRCVVLHSSSNIHVLDVRLGGLDGDRVDWRPNEDLEQLTLKFGKALPQGPASVFLVFEYPLREGLSGFYRSTYKLSDGVEYSLATTQFEANSARMAFPCFDEPAMKAVFSVEVKCPPGLTVLSNMPARAVHQHHDEVATHHFLPSPPMSTYLVAVIVGNLTSVTRPVAGPGGSQPMRNVSVWGTPDRLDNLQFAADTAAAVLPAFERMFGVPYALPKLDLVAIPDFAAGAMENWGLITYRETALLTSPTSNIFDYRYIAHVVAHEMTHQWFGNLVTMDYWGELWLNEGFASYFEFAGATAAVPEQDFFATYYTSDVPYALYFDSKDASHPLAVNASTINSTDAVESFFDAVSYEKGGAVLRMLRSWSNRGAPSWDEALPGVPWEEKFLGGLQQYLLQRQYRTATSAQLWDTLAAPLGVPDLIQRMQAWTYQQGYPLLTATVDGDGNVYLQQARFSLAGTSPCDTSEAWWVPVALVTSDNPGERRWTELAGCQSPEPVAKLSGSGGWVKVNAGQYGYYRVQYDQPLWDALAAAAASTKADGGAPLLSEVDLAGLLEDSFSLAEAGELNITVFLNLVSSLQSRGATEYTPWAVALPYLRRLYPLVSCPSSWRTFVGAHLLQDFLQQGNSSGGNGTGNATAPVFSFAAGSGGGTGSSWPVERQDVGKRMLRPLVLAAAGYFSNAAVKAEALDLMSSLEESPDAAGRLDNDVRTAVYTTAAHSGDSEIYNQIREMYKAAKDPDERSRLLTALGFAGPGGNVQASLEFALSQDVRSQDVAQLVVGLARDAYSTLLDSRKFVWNWLKAHWGDLHAKLGGDDEASRRMGKIMEGVASGFANTSYIQEVDDMYQQHKAQQQEAGYADRAKESIRANTKWVERHSRDVCAWVQQRLQRR
ncbi:hypothetical protein N2152v2_003336 [Parachlorella kessleri]